MTNPIGWCDVTCSPITGCLRNCTYCYARRMAQRLAGRFGYPADDPFRPTFHEDKLHLPQTWKKPRRIFMCSMSDIVAPWTPEAWTRRVLQVADSCPRHTFIFLTKSPENLFLFNPWPANSWVGATVDVRPRLDPTLAALRDVEAPVKFICFEPLLEYMGFPDFANAEVNWIIIGAQTGPGTNHDPLMMSIWVNDLLYSAGSRTRVWLKDNLIRALSGVLKSSSLERGKFAVGLPKIQQFPEAKGGNTMKHVEAGSSGGEDG